MIFIFILRKEIEYPAAVIVEDDNIDVDIVQFGHDQTVHIMIECDIPDHKCYFIFCRHGDCSGDDTVYTVGATVRIHSFFKSGVIAFDVTRSEEHTSELQSRFDLVCRLLLEKKKSTR